MRHSAGVRQSLWSQKSGLKTFAEVAQEPSVEESRSVVPGVWRVPAEPEVQGSTSVSGGPHLRGVISTGQESPTFPGPAALLPPPAKAHS
jgi:hypothetical protein